MTPDNKKPDYSFIMNQPGPDLEKPKRTKKPFIILAAIVVFFGILIGVSLVVSKRSTNVQQISTGQAESVQFLQLLGDGKTEDAYNMYEQNNRPDKQIFDSFAKSYPKVIDMKNCTLRSDVSQISDQASLFVYRCSYFDKAKTGYMDFAVYFQQIDGKKQLTKMQIYEIKS